MLDVLEAVGINFHEVVAVRAGAGEPLRCLAGPEVVQQGCGSHSHCSAALAGPCEQEPAAEAPVFVSQKGLTTVGQHPWLYPAASGSLECSHGHGAADAPLPNPDRRAQAQGLRASMEGTR